MKIYLIQYVDDQAAITTKSFSTMELAEGYLKYMMAIDTDSYNWFITEMELDNLDYKDKTHLYIVFFREQGEFSHVGSIDWRLENGNAVDEGVVAWPGFLSKNPKTDAAIVTILAKSIEEARINSIHRYQQWATERDK